MSAPCRPDPWRHLAANTPARIALGRAGNSLPTGALLDFDIARAQARDAVHAPLDFAAIATDLKAMGLGNALRVRSRCPDRAIYLQRPDLGRCLDPACISALEAGPEGYELALVVADGLSAPAVERHSVPLLAALLPRLNGLRIAPVVLAEQGRVALADEIGALLNAELVLVILGERPGLTAPDSLGAYLTFAPRLGRLDAERNCVSNIRPQGLPPAEAAGRLAWLIRAALARGLTGIQLKDESARLAGAPGSPERLP